jgi:hypothetical protein
VIASAHIGIDGFRYASAYADRGTDVAALGVENHDAPASRSCRIVDSRIWLLGAKTLEKAD